MSTNFQLHFRSIDTLDTRSSRCFVAPIDCSLMVCLDLLRSFLLWCCSCLHNFSLSPLVAAGEDTKGYMRVRAVSHCGHRSLCVPWPRYARGHCGGMHGSHCMRPFRHFMIGYLPSITWSKGWSTLNCNRTNPLMRVLLDVIDLFLAKHCQLHHEIFYDLNLWLLWIKHKMNYERSWLDNASRIIALFLVQAVRSVNIFFFWSIFPILRDNYAFFMKIWEAAQLPGEWIVRK